MALTGMLILCRALCTAARERPTPAPPKGRWSLRRPGKQFPPSRCACYVRQDAAGEMRGVRESEIVVRGVANDKGQRREDERNSPTRRRLSLVGTHRRRTGTLLY
jgi:hypothetical protein